MPEAGFEPADYGIKWQRPTIRPSPAQKVWKNNLAEKNIRFILTIISKEVYFE